ncbi:NAD-dependent deacetylase [Salinisphaera dokdonensis CL-ES53]|uniref:NAD-dependent protein deacetylase n=1 Tax=Salinisphaera dokdonensis CL-ES53 TaxID=1304272 RepID=A0ABV2AWX6_9GAMM
MMTPDAGLSDAVDAPSRAGNVDALHDFIDSHRQVFVLTGAGISTLSGIPDYRDRDGGWKGATPIQHQDFVRKLSKRRRYWARSMAGWPAVARARPNRAHHALYRLGKAGQTSLLVTQNVDGLHQAAGNRSVVDLHGRLDRVVCLDCGTRLSRHRVQEMLVAANAGWLHDSDAIRPDGDIELGDVDYEQFVVPDCPVCRGILKPDVVFFGGAVPQRTVARAWKGLARSDAVLVVGSSLMVWSGYRFVREAARNGLPIMAVNRGRTRADALITHKLDDDCGALLDAAIAPA